MNQRISRLSVFSCVLLLVASCASIVGKTVYPVAITSQPDQADITIADETGKAVFAGKTPTTVTLNTKAGYFQGKDYTVTFSKPGYAKQTTQIKRGISGWYLGGNFFFGGLIDWLIVDPLTGAMWTLPEETTVKLAPQTSMQGAETTMQVVSLDQVPDSLRSKMVRVR
jgi:hypothetical protein